MSTVFWFVLLDLKKKKNYAPPKLIQNQFQFQYRFLPAFKEGNVNWRGVEVNKLEDENFEDEHVFIFVLSAMHF